MDRLENLASQISQVTMYDLKSMYNQAKNAVLNVSPMEAKVNEATNDDPWGASSTLMQEIAAGTFNFQHFNEIMPCIYTRFMEKEARQWREIYKALQLLEYIIKHGSERVVDDARSHMSTIKMLRSFHYIDENGKDQGINVRNRSKELVDLLGDLDRIRTERRKAKTNKNKYTGVGSDGMGFSGGGRYGGFGNDSLGNEGGYGGGGSYDPDYNGGGSYSGNYGGSGGSSGGFKDDSQRRGFEEYDAGDSETGHRRSGSLSKANISTVVTPRKAGDPPPRTTVTTKTSTSSTAKAVAPPPSKEANLLDFDNDDFGATISAPAPKATSASLDDDFDDFQSAPAVAPMPSVQPITQKSTVPTSKPNVFDMLGGGPTGNSFSATPVATKVSSPIVPLQRQPFSSSGHAPQGSQSAFASFNQAGAMKPNYNSSPSLGTPLSPTAPTSSASAFTPSTSKKTPGGFDDLWSISLGGSSSAKPAAANNNAGKTIKDLEREKAQAAMWGSQGNPKPNAFGTFGGGFGGASSTSGGTGGGDDLLL